MPQVTITFDVPVSVLERIFLDALISTDAGKAAVAQVLTNLSVPSTPPIAEIIRDLQNRSIDEIDFSVRTYNCLKKAGIVTVGRLIRCSPHDLLAPAICNFGKKSLCEVMQKLAELGFSLAEETNSYRVEEVEEEVEVEVEEEVEEESED